MPGGAAPPQPHWARLGCSVRGDGTAGVGVLLCVERGQVAELGGRRRGLRCEGTSQVGGGWVSRARRGCEGKILLKVYGSPLGPHWGVKKSDFSHREELIPLFFSLFFLCSFCSFLFLFPSVSKSFTSTGGANGKPLGRGTAAP